MLLTSGTSSFSTVHDAASSFSTHGSRWNSPPCAAKLLRRWTSFSTVHGSRGSSSSLLVSLYLWCAMSECLLARTKGPLNRGGSKSWSIITQSIPTPLLYRWPYGPPSQARPKYSPSAIGPARSSRHFVPWVGGGGASSRVRTSKLSGALARWTLDLLTTFFSHFSPLFLFVFFFFQILRACFFFHRFFPIFF